MIPYAATVVGLVLYTIRKTSKERGILLRVAEKRRRA
jgi:heme exporter protein D